MLINIKMPTIVGILTFMRGKIALSVYLSWKKAEYFYTYEHLKFHAQLSWAWKKFYNHYSHFLRQSMTSKPNTYFLSDIMLKGFDHLQKAKKTFFCTITLKTSWSEATSRKLKLSCEYFLPSPAPSHENKSNIFWDHNWIISHNWSHTYSLFSLASFCNQHNLWWPLIHL